MNEGKWVPIRIAAEYYGISKGTLREWDKRGKITTKRTLSHQRRFLIPKKK